MDKASINLIVTFISILFFVMTRKIVLLVVIFIIALYSIFKERFTLKYNKITKLYLVFWGYYIFISMINILFNKYENQFTSFVNLLFKVTLIIIIMIICNYKKGISEKFFVFYRNFGLFLCIIGIFEFMLKKSLFYNIATVEAINWQFSLFGTKEFRIFTAFLHPIVYGSFLVVLYWINKSYPLKNYYMNKLSILLILINIFATKSRSCWIALGVTVIINIVFLKKVKIRKKINLNLILGTLITIILLVIFKEKLSAAFYEIVNKFIVVLDSTLEVGSRTQRLGAISNIIDYGKGNFIQVLFGQGAGYGTVFMKNNPVNIGFDIVDNQYFTMILEVGFIGVIIFLYIAMKVLLNLKTYSLNKSGKAISFSILTIYITIFFFEGLAWESILYILTISIFLIKDNNYSVKEVEYENSNDCTKL